MTRYVFFFSLVGGDMARLSTTNRAEAQKLRSDKWATGAAYYYTPWMDPMYGDAEKVIPGGSKTRVNLVHVIAVNTYEIEDED